MNRPLIYPLPTIIYPLPTIRNTKAAKNRTRKIEAAHSETLPI